MTKDKIVILSVVDADSLEVKLLTDAIESLNLSYTFIISNREINSFSKDELITVLKELTK